MSTTATPTPPSKPTPERLSLWDRWFNCERREIAKRGQENWSYVTTSCGIPLESTRRTTVRDYVDYRIIDRVTGSERIEREYLN